MFNKSSFTPAESRKMGAAVIESIQISRESGYIIKTESGYKIDFNKRPPELDEIKKKIEPIRKKLQQPSIISGIHQKNFEIRRYIRDSFPSRLKIESVNEEAAAQRVFLSDGIVKLVYYNFKYNTVECRGDKY